MGFFNKPILGSDRVKALDNFRAGALKALKELEKGAKTPLEKGLYSRMARNVEGTQIFFYPRKTLREKIFHSQGRVYASVVKGEHVNVIKIFQKGKQRFIIRDNYINMPAEHVFEGKKLSIDGIFTLAHEYAHFPKPALGQFAEANGISYEQAEELMADTLSAKLAVSMGYPKEMILKHFKGRELVYGKFPFRKMIWNAVNR